MKRQIATGTNPRYERDKCRAIPTLQKAFRRIIRRAGSYDKEVCIHTCRHSVAALIVSRGGTLYDVQAQLGHRNIQSSQRYAHLHPQRLKATGQLIEQHIGDTLSKYPFRQAILFTLSEQVQVSKALGQITPYCFFADVNVVSKAPDGQ